MMKLQFPQIHRIIPSILSLFVSIIVWGSIISVIVGNIFIGLPLFEDKKRNEDINKMTVEKENAQERIDMWEHVVEVLPHYQYAYLSLAKEYYQIDQKETAKHYLEKAMILNPVDPVVQSLEQMMQ